MDMSRLQERKCGYGTSKPQQMSSKKNTQELVGVWTMVITQETTLMQTIEAREKTTESK
jgi:hypothetical protein